MDHFQSTRQPDHEWWKQLWPDPEQTLELLGIGPGTSLADVGCGDGFFTLLVARLIDEAPVYAIDINEEILEAVETAAAAERIANVETLLDSVWRPRLESIGDFGVVCTVCGNTVTTEGESVEIESGDRHLVCCTPCASLIADQYEQL
ncbi:S-adenosylmethionine-dependent methyltransferase 3 [Halococcus morrhuae DSM 1307]|uniref:S-adenosylmethionine-dependent methyltransferase 3 n=1 Tax=Halococcus morrhuae DSM 1307 TaxID=931277 RepID=M0MQS1_HALMO|nr:class I SAM-dependent methyltransferase [Halococcus morrhuae]EMA46825.1 S-adenosylmethionine-dependent methyltransferase 3 [Halococcus morrhuae DSM 1307]